MNPKNYLGVLITALSLSTPITAQDFHFGSSQSPIVGIADSEEPVVQTAWQMFASDYEQVFNTPLSKGSKNASLLIGTLGTKSDAEKLLSRAQRKELQTHPEAFVIANKKGKLAVVGSDKRGTAYGILELSRIIGVSPWVWWADATPLKQTDLTIPDQYYDMQYPSVRNRGIFINDEDWGMTPWSWKNYEPSSIKGSIGPKTHARIFELLLRLRANTFWPAMHNCSVPFFLTPGNKETADKYGIQIGTSHCEPMVCNVNGEWNKYSSNRYNYLTNHDEVVRFWENRVKLLAHSDNIYTLGMRGVHDGPMEGAKTPLQQKVALTHIIKEQREMIARHVNKDVTKVPQVFIPYKEVLEAYQLGLEVPDDVTLMWCDDNYGYIRHFPDSTERQRSGGNGIYYHVSYWGRPHDYLWLSSTHPALLYTQLKQAFEHNTKDLWILNVGDIKPAEYDTELFMDMAWNMDMISPNKKGLQDHQRNWLCREFGEELGKELLPIMDEYYRLAFIHRPEFMGNTRTEEKTPESKQIKDLPFTLEEIAERRASYRELSNRVQALKAKVSDEKQAAWFELVEYPVRCAALMNDKFLSAQLARHGMPVDGQSGWAVSDAAYDTIQMLTQEYSSMLNGKWQFMMDCHIKKMQIFDRIKPDTIATSIAQNNAMQINFNGMDYAKADGLLPTCYGLGYGSNAAHMAQGSTLHYAIPASLKGQGDSLEIEIDLLPVHPAQGRQQRFAIGIDNASPTIINYATQGRSEEWKMNVLWNQARRKVRVANPLSDNGERKHYVTIQAIDPAVTVDEIHIAPLR